MRTEKPRRERERDRERQTGKGQCGVTMGMMSTRSTTQTSAVAMGFRGDRYALRCIQYYSTSIVSSHDHVRESLRQLLCGAPWRPIIVHRPIGRAPFRNLSISRFRFQRITRSFTLLKSSLLAIGPVNGAVAVRHWSRRRPLKLEAGRYRK